MRKFLWAIGFSVLASSVLAKPARLDANAIDDFAREMEREHHFDHVALTNVLRLGVRLDSVLAAINKPAEYMPWRRYRTLFLTQERISAGESFWQRNADLLSKAETEYGVAPEYIVAIIGVETFYGRNVGNYRVLDALSTLAFHFPKRAAFFRQELVNFFLMTRDEELDPIKPRGSYAGAMGVPQFMPSSFRNFAVDFDQDKHRDLWHDPDAIGSVANYFAQHGWKSGQLVAVPVAVGEVNQANASEDVELKKTVGELLAAGVKPEGSVDADARAVLLRFEGAAGDEYWLALSNFYVITRYNRSPKYARAVEELAQALRAQHTGAKATP